jgi:serine/threonine protein phosphatase PrpC
VAQASSNVGSASHLGENQLIRDSHFIYDYANRRVPLPVVSYMAVADASGDLPSGESPAKKALSMLGDIIEPAVIAEEELNPQEMEKLIRNALSEVNASLKPDPGAVPPTPGAQVSLTVVVADAHRAYIGHVGTTRVYLLHDERLYDLVPKSAAVREEPPPSSQEPLPAAPSPQGDFIGQATEAHLGYNHVDITPGDTLILCTDGLWRTVSEEEIVENLLSAMGVQRSANQLARLAFSRDATDNATIVIWKYPTSDEAQEMDARSPKSGRARKSRFSEAVLVVLLGLVLLGIFAVGFAFGWRITDTFRKPQKEAASKARKTAEERAKQTTPQTSAAQSQPGQTQAGQSQATTPSEYPKNATVNGQGVRLRASPNPNSQIVGTLQDGQKVTVTGETTGTDSKSWSQVQGTVKVEGKDTQVAGYVRGDFLKVSQ